MFFLLIIPFELQKSSPAHWPRTAVPTPYACWRPCAPSTRWSPQSQPTARSCRAPSALTARLARSWTWLPAGCGNHSASSYRSDGLFNCNCFHPSMTEWYFYSFVFYISTSSTNALHQFQSPKNSSLVLYHPVLIHFRAVNLPLSLSLPQFCQFHFFVMIFGPLPWKFCHMASIKLLLARILGHLRTAALFLLNVCMTLLLYFQVYKTAVETAILLLRIDDIVSGSKKRDNAGEGMTPSQQAAME